MAAFQEGKPIASPVPTIQVDAGLAPGTYQFQLIVEDDSGNRSAPDVKIVQIVQSTTAPR
jgi:hypothetical protein